MEGLRLSTMTACTEVNSNIELKNLYKLLNNDFTFKPKTIGQYKKLLGMTDDNEYLFTIENWIIFSRLLIEKYNIPVHAGRSMTSRIKSLFNLN